MDDSVNMEDADEKRQIPLIRLFYEPSHINLFLFFNNSLNASVDAKRPQMPMSRTYISYTENR